MIERNEKTWKELKQRLKKGNIIQGKVVEVEPFGIFLDINESFLGLVLGPQISDKEFISIEDFPKLGDNLEGVIIDFSDEEYITDYNFAYVSISLKGVSASSR